MFQMTLNRSGGDDVGSDMDEPMASQSADSEAPLTSHNTSKSNFFNGEERQAGMLNTSRGSFKV